MISVKDFQENKKTVDDDRNVLYNVYIKIKGWFDVGGPSQKDNYEFFIGDTGDEIHTEWQMNITLYKHMRRKTLLINQSIY